MLLPCFATYSPYFFEFLEIARRIALACRVVVEEEKVHLDYPPWCQYRKLHPLSYWYSDCSPCAQFIMVGVETCHNLCEIMKLCHIIFHRRKLHVIFIKERITFHACTTFPSHTSQDKIVHTSQMFLLAYTCQTKRLFPHAHIRSHHIAGIYTICSKPLLLGTLSKRN